MRFIDLQEGPNDPGIFKAIFLAGGPGSGKGYVAQQLGLQARGLKVVNSDDAFEYLMRKRKLSFEMPPEEQPDRDVARQRAKDLTNKRQDIYLDGRLGIIIDGTAKDPNKMAKLKAELEAIGYQTMMVFVNTSLRTALQRNLLRDRKVPTDIVTQSHKQVQTNKDTLSNVFAPNYVEVNNDDNANFNEPLKRVEKFIDAPVTAQARDWISKASVQKSIAQEDVQSKPKVYVDMDGVLANFYAGVTRVTGHEEPRDMALQDIEDTMASFKGTDFFYRLPKYEQTDQLIAMVNAATKGDWYILSSPLKYDREGSAKYKAAWIRDKLKIQPKDMYFQSDKAQFATQPDGTPNILIDDYPKYLNSWKDKGGIGVQYKGHAGNIEDVKATLDQYFSKKKVAEALDSSYPYKNSKRNPGNAFYFDTEDGQEYKVEFDSVFAGDVRVAFAARGQGDEHKIGLTGTGDSRKIFGTVIKIVKDYVRKAQPEAVSFSANNSEPSRVRLYKMLASQADKELPNYKFADAFSNGGFTTYYLTRDGAKIPTSTKVKAKAGKVLDKVFDSQQPKIHTSKIGETILTEEQLVEGFLDSAKDYLGNAYTQTVADIKTNIVDLKQAGIVIKDVLTDPQQTAIVNAQLGKQINMIVKQMISSANVAVAPMVKFIQQNILPVVRVDGIKGFLGRLGVYGVLKYVSTQLSKLTDVAKNELLGLMADIVKQVSSAALTMSAFMGIFDNVASVKKYFLDVLSYIKSKIMSVQIRRPTESVQIDELADKPYSYSQNVKTPDKRAYRFQTDAGQLYRVQVFNRRKDDANKLEIHFDLTNMKTGQPNSGVTGTGDAVRVFSTVANILQQEVADQDPTGIIIASKADDESRVKLYRTLARRAAKTMSGFEISGERTVTGGDGNPYITIELTKQ